MRRLPDSICVYSSVDYYLQTLFNMLISFIHISIISFCTFLRLDLIASASRPFRVWVELHSSLSCYFSVSLSLSLSLKTCQYICRQGMIILNNFPILRNQYLTLCSSTTKYNAFFVSEASQIYHSSFFLLDDWWAIKQANRQKIDAIFFSH